MSLLPNAGVDDQIKKTDTAFFYVNYAKTQVLNVEFYNITSSIK